MIGAVVLAAGRSLRMGRPKMGLAWDNTTVIGRVVEVLSESGVGDILVVTGGARDIVEKALTDCPVRTVFNPDYANGEMICTLQVGIAAMRDGVKAALVVLGDQPQIKNEVVHRVIAAYKHGEHALVIPSYQMRRGHPWLIRRDLWDVLLEMKPPATMRDFLNQFESDVFYVDVDTSSILQDLDTPEDYLHYQTGESSSQNVSNHGK